MGLLKGVVERRKDLKIIVMSATLDAQKFQDTSASRTTKRHSSPFLVAHILSRYSTHLNRNVIMLKQHYERSCRYMPQSRKETYCCSSRARKRSKTLVGRSSSKPMRWCGKQMLALLLSIPLYGSLNPAQQQKIFDKAPAPFRPGARTRRKCIVSTNIAETSVDELTVLSMSSIRVQQAESLQPSSSSTSHILKFFRSNLSSTVLELKKLGIDDLVHFDLMDPPAPETLMRALEELNYLACLDDEGEAYPPWPAGIRIPSRSRSRSHAHLFTRILLLQRNAFPHLATFSTSHLPTPGQRTQTC
ncbi:hypothetical protein MRB53_037202 [Persea americana]|nr:hypothetical protein MRB53_037202 [Persea americana]